MFGDDERLNSWVKSASNPLRLQRQRGKPSRLPRRPPSARARRRAALWRRGQDDVSGQLPREQCTDERH